MKRHVKQKKYDKFNAQQERFIKAFIDVAYENMAIEHETPLTRREAYKRYRADAIDLIRDGTYKNIHV
ncbi:MAG: hypothetical protein AAB604_00755 [Patescibacteria group bacterium]